MAHDFHGKVKVGIARMEGASWRAVSVHVGSIRHRFVFQNKRAPCCWMLRTLTDSRC